MKTRTWSKDAWTPIRRGVTYCSPACGGNCTYKEFLSATENAKALCSKLGKGWKPRVWENLGWHYSVQSPNGCIRVHGDTRSFTAFLGDKNESGGRYAETRRTAKAAISAVIEKAKADLNKINAILLDQP